MSTEKPAVRDLATFKGVDVVVNKDGCTFTPVIIRAVADKGEAYATIDFEIRPGKKFVTASVSKQYGIDVINEILFYGDKWRARIWTFSSNENAQALLKAAIRNKIAEDIALLNAALAAVSE